MCRTWSSCMHMTVIRMWLSIKLQATVDETKSKIATQKVGQVIIMVRLASPACMLCPVFTVAACTCYALCRMCLHWGCTLADMLIDVTRSMWRVTQFHCEWAIVATQTMALTDETFSPWSSPYRSSHWIGRSMSGLRPCCCHRGGTDVFFIKNNGICLMV